MLASIHGAMYVSIIDHSGLYGSSATLVVAFGCIACKLFEVGEALNKYLYCCLFVCTVSTCKAYIQSEQHELTVMVLNDAESLYAKRSRLDQMNEPTFTACGFVHRKVLIKPISEQVKLRALLTQCISQRHCMHRSLL